MGFEEWKTTSVILKSHTASEIIMYLIHLSYSFFLLTSYLCFN